jgi:hypothetical protein
VRLIVVYNIAPRPVGIPDRHALVRGL